jgi:tRNA dimethylallyltransferase
VYRGLQVVTGAPSADERRRLEHRLVGFVDPGEEFTAGRFAELARAEIDALVAEGRRPIVVGGTGLYLRAALADIELRPPVDPAIRIAVQEEIERRGVDAVHAELEPEAGAAVHPHDRQRVARAVELQRAGLKPRPAGGGELWTARLRHPTELVGLVIDRGELDERIEARVDAMVAAGAADEVSAAQASGASRTARSAIGFAELLAGDVNAITRAQRRYARRQLTWMRKMPGVTPLDRTGSTDAEVAAEIAARLPQYSRP